MDPKAIKAAKIADALLVGNVMVAQQLIRSLSTDDKLDTVNTLSFKRQQALLVFTVDRLPTHQDMCTAVASLFGETLAQYLYRRMATVLPYALRLPIRQQAEEEEEEEEEEEQQEEREQSKWITTEEDTTVLVEAIATCLHHSSSREVYQAYGYLAVLHWLLLPSPHKRDTLMENSLMAMAARMEMENNSSKDQVARTLLQGHVTQVVSLLAMELWRPDHQRVLDALGQVIEWMTHQNSNVTVTSYINAYMLGILSHFNKVLVGNNLDIVSISTASAERANVLSSLITLLDILNDNAFKFMPQLLSIARTVLEDPVDNNNNNNNNNNKWHSCTHRYYLLWKRLLTLVSAEQSQYFGDVVRGMASMLPLCDHDTQEKLADDLDVAIKGRVADGGTSWVSEVPDLPTDYGELLQVQSFIEQEREYCHEEQMKPPKQDNHRHHHHHHHHHRHQYVSDGDGDNTQEEVDEEEVLEHKQRVLRRLIVYMSMDEVTPSFDSLQQLHTMLSKEQYIFFTPGNTNTVQPLLGEVYDVLLRIIRQHHYLRDICGLAASCLGLVGAIDPSRLLSLEERRALMRQIKTEETQQDNKHNNTVNNVGESNNHFNTPNMIVLNNFANQTENQNFAVHLILHYLLPTFQPSTLSSSFINDRSLVTEQCSQYAIQQLFKAVDVTAHTITDIGTEAAHLWSSLDPTVRNFLNPFLSSKFSYNSTIVLRNPPLYETATESFKVWIRSLYYFLLGKVIGSVPSGSRGHGHRMIKIFQACVPSVEAGHVALTQYLLPFMALRILLSCDDLARQQILEEILGILKKDTLDRDMKQQFLRVVVSITSHCQTWIRKRTQLMKRQLSHQRDDRDITTVRRFLNGIPHHLMGRAAFRTENYPQAMMHLEQYARDRENKIPPDDVDDLCQTYMHLEGPDMMAVVLSKFSQSLSPHQEILRFESRGEWHYARASYEDILMPDAAHSNRNNHNNMIMGVKGGQYAVIPPLTNNVDDDDGCDDSVGTRKYTKKRKVNVNANGDNNDNDNDSQTEEKHPVDQRTLVGRYFHCLKQLGEYDRMINSATNMMHRFEDLQPLLNAYRAEAAWKSANWHLLQQYVKAPMEETFDGLLARMLAHMQSEHHLAVYLDVEKARRSQIDRISQSGYGSYRHCYDAVFNLQLLQEIESVLVRRSADLPTIMDQTDANAAAPNATSASIATFSFLGTDKEDVDLQFWKTKFKLIKPSYQTQRQLLDLRLAVEFGIWKNNPLQPTVRDNVVTMTNTEKDLYLLLAKTARKEKDLETAYGALQPIAHEPLAMIEKAKWYFDKRDPKLAASYLLHPALLDHTKAKFLYARYNELYSKKYQESATSTSDLITVSNYYAEVRKEAPDWEKAYFVSGECEENRDGAGSGGTSGIGSPLNIKSVKRAQTAISFYCEALQVGSRYYYNTMPRLLSLWLQLSEALRDLGRHRKNMHEVRYAEALRAAYTAANKSILASMEKIPPYLFGLTLPRLVSRLAIDDKEVAVILAKIILRVFIAYPQTTIWSLQYGLHSDDSTLKHRSNLIINQADKLRPNSLVSRVIQQTQLFVRYLEALSKEKHPQPTSQGSLSKHAGLLQMENLDICIPQETALLPSIPESTSSSPLFTTAHLPRNRHEPYPSKLPTIVRVLPTMQVMNSLQKPKRITFAASDGNEYAFLCKSNDDLRKDARMMEFSHMINKFLVKNAISREQRLYIRTYAVIPLGKKWGLIQWINNLSALKAVVTDMWDTMGIDGARHVDVMRRKVKDKQPRSLEERMRSLLENVYPHTPVVFYKWFLEQFPEPAQWFTCRSRYVRTLAVMSIVGYVLGLGDRHAENIMFDATNGDTVHVDVNMLFDHGQELAVPETVPFRLTRNLIDAMGVTKESGLFRKSCITTLTVLRESRSQLISVFETFLHDPIGDRRNKDLDLTHEEVAMKEIAKISNKITSEFTVQQEVDNLIREAASNKNLAQMFFGWSAFI